MRDIKFRGKDKETGEWVFGTLMILEMPNSKTRKLYRAFYIVDEKDNFRIYKNEVIPETVGQYIGITDRHNKMIFDGDIIENNHGDIFTINYGEYIPQIIRDYLTQYPESKIKPLVGFYAKDIEDEKKYILPKSEAYWVIGNIYQNKDLLERIK